MKMTNLDKLKSLFEKTLDSYLTIEEKFVKGGDRSQCSKTAFIAGFVTALTVTNVSDKDKEEMVDSILQNAGLEKNEVQDVLCETNLEPVNMNAEERLPGQKNIAILVHDGDAFMVAEQLNCITDRPFAKAADKDLILVDQWPEQSDVKYAFMIIANLCEKFQVMGITSGTGLVHKKSGEEYEATENGFICNSKKGAMEA